MLLSVPHVLPIILRQRRTELPGVDSTPVALGVVETLALTKLEPQRRSGPYLFLAPQLRTHKSIPLTIIRFQRRGPSRLFPNTVTDRWSAKINVNEV
jgi:hypothetical protein